MYIGVTQRVERTNFNEVRDVLDQAWARLLQQLGHTPLPLCTDVDSVPSYLDSLPLDALILSGGNDLAHLENAQNSFKKRDEFEYAVIEYCLAQQIPMLGVCRGMQVLNDYFGGSLIPVKGHAGSRHFVTYEDASVSVNSYHNWGIPQSGLAKKLSILATDSEGMVEAFSGPNLIGIMWHPEREDVLTDIDNKIFTKFMQIKS